MDDKARCQSCGMPLSEGFYGTEAGGGLSKEYCTFCYQNGYFTKPDMTMQEMMEMSVENMIQDLNFPIEEATDLASEMIPKLKRWKVEVE